MGSVDDCHRRARICLLCGASSVSNPPESATVKAEIFNDVAAQQIRRLRAVTTETQLAQAYGLPIACHVAQVETVWTAWHDANINSAPDHYHREAAGTVKTLLWDYGALVHKEGGWAMFFHRMLLRITGGRDLPREENKTAATLPPSPFYGQNRRWHPYQEPDHSSSSSVKEVKKGNDKRKNAKGDKSNSKAKGGKGKPDATKGDSGKDAAAKGDRGKLGDKGDKGKGKEGKPVGKGRGPLPPQPHSHQP
ncbi:unnamed protein product, partial [Amoebophrya sp. A25]|eukprot:GSA25T00027466001.1